MPPPSPRLPCEPLPQPDGPDGPVPASGKASELRDELVGKASERHDTAAFPDQLTMDVYNAFSAVVDLDVPVSLTSTIRDDHAKQAYMDFQEFKDAKAHLDLDYSHLRGRQQCMVDATIDSVTANVWWASLQSQENICLCKDGMAHRFSNTCLVLG